MAKKGETKYPELKDKKWLEIQYSEKGLYIREIAKIIGCSYTIVQKAIGLHNIPRRTKSEALKGINIGKRHTPETIEKIRKSSKNRHHTQEAKDKIQKALMGNTSREGQHLTIEHKLRIGEANRGRRLIPLRGRKGGLRSL